jgi:hypothetical protein
MKKIYLLFFALTLVVILFIVYDSKLENKSQAIGKTISVNPELLIFHFQPSLKENTEVVINFEKKYIVFRPMYPFFPEPPTPPGKDGKTDVFSSQRKPIKSYLANLRDEDLKYFRILITSLSTSDYKRIEDVYIDGTSYNFSILFSNKILKNGFIAQDKTKNQEEIIIEILKLLHKTNRQEENLEILKYYSNTIN